MEGVDAQIVIAGGGTGGHLFPALAVADELKRRHAGAAIAFIGSRSGLETRLVPEAGYSLWRLPLSGLKGRGLAARAVAALAAAWSAARCLLRFAVRRPGLVIGVGGFASGPAVLAASTIGIPTMVLEQNHLPGTTNRWLARRVDAVCLPSEAARRRIGGRRFVTGNPVRAEFGFIEPRTGGERTHLLVFGGSRGARSLNRAMLRALPGLAALATPPRIVHQTGAADEDGVRRGYAAYPAGSWEVRAFLDDMPRRFAEADLIVARSGATTVAELAAAGRAAVLVPYPHAADDHQRHNAAPLVDAGAALLIDDAELDDALPATLASLIADPARCRKMAAAARSLARPDATARIAEIAGALLRGETPEPDEVPRV